MNINQSYGQTNFGNAYIDSDGFKKFCKNEPTKQFKNEFLHVAEIAKNSKENDLILDRNGVIYFQNAKYGKFTTANPTATKQEGNVFSVKIEDDNGEEQIMNLKMKSEKDAEIYCDAFRSSTFVPESRLELFLAMEAASKYKNAVGGLK